jgi:putative membrane protein
MATNAHSTSRSAFLQLIWVLVVVAVIVGVLALMRGAHGNDDGSARRILEVRFARGEIDEDEFNRRVATLKG